MSSAAAEVGSTANRYRILAKLASGGMAEIFLARGEGVAGVERYCVLKRILRDRADDVHFVRMFLDEARLAAQLQHPNIAQVHDIGKLGDSYFFTMEYVHGETVRALMHRAQGLRRTLPVTGVLTIVAGTAAGLHHAHVRVGVDGRPLGIVHRDVSPSNLMVSYEGGVKVVDFGVAKAEDRSQETKSGTVKGKISYLSPEQCRGQRVDRRSDLFSLGICFWEMLTIERLYRRSSDFENMNAIVTEPTPPPSSVRPDVPPEVDALVLRLLAKDPDDRFQSADEVVEAVEAVAAQTGSVLSASGLGRLVRELFGARPEPWLEIERQHEQGEALTLASEPIPRELAVSPGERIDRQLSSVIDLSAPRSITESLDSRQVVPTTPSPEVSATQPGKIGKPVKRGFPLAPPPLTQPGIAPAEAIAVRPSNPATVVIPPSSDGFTPSSKLELPAGRAPPVAPVPRAPSSGPRVTPSGLRTASIPPPATAGSSGAVRRRSGWPLYAVIAGAAVIGSIAVVLVTPPRSGTRDTSGASMAAGAQASSIEAAANRRREPITVEPITVEPIDPVPAGPAVPAVPAGPAGPPAPPGLPAPAGPLALSAGAARSAAAGGPAAGELPTGAGTAAVAPPRALAAPRVAPSHLAGAAIHPAPPRPAGKREPSPPPDDLSRLYGAGHYDKVLDQCAGPVSAEHAPLCFLSACQAGNEALARRLITAVPAARRDSLTVSCKQLGVDIEKPDCEADPMACQH